MALKQYSVLAIADYFLYLDTLEQRATVRITNLKLQKLLYYAQGYSLALHDAPLFNEEIEAWPHGPVSPHTYRRYSTYGAAPIPPLAGYDPDELDSETRTLLDVVQARYGLHAAWALREMTHKELPYTQTQLYTIIECETMHNFFSRELRPALRRLSSGEIVAETLNTEERVPTGEFTPAQREQLIRGAIATEALEGFTLPRDIAEAAFAAALRKPLPNIG